jgi:hypothetical protein
MEPHERLDEAMRQRRRDLRIRTWRDLAAAADISYETLRAVRAGGKPAEATRDGLERALRWPPGTIEAILGGLDLDQFDRSPPDERPTSEILDDIEIVAEEVLEILTRRGITKSARQRKVAKAWAQSYVKTVREMEEPDAS